MNIVIFANGERGLNVFNALQKENYNVVALVTIEKNKYFFEENISESLILSLNNVNENNSLRILEKFAIDIFVVAGFSQIFKKEILSIPKLGTINLHAGKLPYYRGGSPLNWQLINCEKTAGISAIMMDEGIDTGKILAEKEFKIEDNDTIKTLHLKANKLFPKLILESIIKIKNGYLGKTQDDSKAIYWHQRCDKDGEINFKNHTANEVHCLIRALSNPYPGAWAIYKGGKVIFKKSEIPNYLIKGTPGKILYLNQDGPYILCKDRAILIKEYEIYGNIEYKLINKSYFS